MKKCSFDKIEIIKYTEWLRQKESNTVFEDSSILIDETKKKNIEEHLKTCPLCKKFSETYLYLLDDLKKIQLKEKEDTFWAEMKTSILKRIYQQEVKLSQLSKIKLFFSKQKRHLVKVLATAVLVILFTSSYLFMQHKYSSKNISTSSLSDSEIDMILIFNGEDSYNKITNVESAEDFNILPETVLSLNPNENNLITTPEDDFYLELLNSKEIISSL